MNLTVEEIKAVIHEKIPQGLVLPDHDQFGHKYNYTPTGERIKSVTTKSGILDGGPHLKAWAAKMATQHINDNLDKITPENKDSIFKAAVMAHQGIFEDAGDIGTQGHDIVDAYLKDWMRNGYQPKDITTYIKGVDARLWAITRSAELFCNDFEVTPVASELFVGWPKDGIAGQLDAMAMVGRPIGFPDRWVGETGQAIKCQRHQYWCTSTSRQLYTCRQCGQNMKKELTLVDWKTSNSIDKYEYAMQVSAYWWAFYKLTGLRPLNILIVRLDKKKAKYEVMRVTDRPAAFRAWKNAAKVHDWMDGPKALEPVQPKEQIKL